jgi:hypothetical protein
LAKVVRYWSTVSPLPYRRTCQISSYWSTLVPGAHTIRRLLVFAVLVLSLRFSYHIHRLMKAIAEAQSAHGLSAVLAPAAVTEEVAEDAVGDDFDFNIEGGDEDANVSSVVKQELSKLPAGSDSGTNGSAVPVYDSLYVLVLELVEVYLDLSPQSVAAVKFDLLRLLDESLPWEAGQSDDSARKAAEALSVDTLLTILRVLRLATERTECRWFGTQEDAVKMLINLIVAEDWRKATKRTVLMKLFLLCTAATEEVSRRARNLLKLVLIQSGLFLGHGFVDYELNSEMNAWLEPSDLVGDALLVQEVLLRLAYHWNTPLSIEAAETAQASYLAAVGSPLAGPGSAALAPFSPVLYCAMQLAGTNFETFSSLLPKHIRAHMGDGESSAGAHEDSFFDKYKAHFRVAVERTVARVVVCTISCARSPLATCQSLEAAWKGATKSDVVQGDGAGNLLAQLQVLVHVPSAKTIKGWEALAQECPATFRNALTTDSEATNRSAKKKAITAPKEAVEGDLSLRDRFSSFAAQCAAVVTKWSGFGVLLEQSGDAGRAVVAFAEKYWMLLCRMVLSDPDRAQQHMNAELVAWAVGCWQRSVHAAHGVHSKLLLVEQGLQLLRQLRVTTASHYVWATADGGLHIAEAWKTGKAAPVRSGRKRTQSDLSAEQGGEFASLMLPLSSAVAEGSLALMQTVLSAPALPTVVITEAAIAELRSSTWLGSWLRVALTRLVSARRSAAERGHVRVGDVVDSLWSALANAVVTSGLKLEDGTASAELLEMAGGLAKIVNSPELQKLLVEHAPAERLSHTDALKRVCPHAPDAPVLAVLDRVAEDALRASSLSQLVGAVEAANVDGPSPLTCPLFRYGSAETAAYYMNLRSMAPEKRDGTLERKLNESVKSLSVASSKPTYGVLLREVFTGALQRTGDPAGDEAASRSMLIELCDTVASRPDSAQHLSVLAQVVRSDGTVAPAAVLHVLSLCLASSTKAVSADTWTLFFDAACEQLVAAVDGGLAALSATTGPGLTHAARGEAGARLSESLGKVNDLLQVPALRNKEPAASSAQAVAMKKKLNKLAKSAVKGGLEVAPVLHWLRALLVTLTGHTPTLLQGTLHPSEDDFFSPKMLFELIPTHSKFTTVLAPSKDGTHPAKEHLLALVLHLVASETASSAKKVSGARKGKSAVVKASPEQYLLADAVLAGYGGTLSASDRIALRVLTLLHRAGLCPSLCTLQPRAVSGVVTTEGLRSEEELLADSAKWVVEGIKPPAVYATLGRFPLWRTLEPQPFAFLEEAHRALDVAGLTAGSIESQWKASKPDADADSATGSENDGADEEALQREDLLQHCSDKVLDPAFFMPAFLHVLRNREVSVRQLANSGALSLIIACLGSPCTALRTYALACLQFVQNMLEQQTPTRDAAFRERAQLSLLLTYIRNSFELDSAAVTAPRLPVTTAIFLGRAAMNLMQPSHELFSRVNKYLLSRPFCDVKDVPLYDLLLVNGDAQSDQMQRLAALRLFRDGLQTRDDHLNLCRKNAYNRLMLLFPLIAKDVRAGHAVLDLLDRGLSLKFSARYLLERCLLTSWVKLLAAPMGAMQLRSVLYSDSAEQTTNKKATDLEGSSQTHYSKYLVRALTILRRIIASSYLLALEDASCALHLQGVHAAINAVAWDAAHAVQGGYADSIPAEYFVQLALCMWDLSSAAVRTPSAGFNSSSLWDDALLSALSLAVDSKLMPSAGSGPVTRSVAGEELQVALLSLVRFSTPKPHKEARGLIVQCLKQASCAHLLGMKDLPTGAVAVMAPATLATQHKSQCDLAPHAVLGNVTALPYYTSVCDYYAAAMEAESLGDTNQFQRLATAWTAAAAAELSQMTALPTSLGRSFVASFVCGVMAMAGPGDSSEAGALDTLRWLLIMRCCFPHHGAAAASTHPGTAGASVLSPHRVASHLRADAGLASQGPSCWLKIAIQAVMAARTSLVSKHPAAGDVATKLGSVLPQLCAPVGEVGHVYTELADALFEYLSLLVTLYDHQAARGAEHASLRTLLNAKAAHVLAACTQSKITSQLPLGGAPSLQEFVVSAMTSEFRTVPGTIIMDAAAICLPQGQAQRNTARSVPAVNTLHRDAPDEMDVASEGGDGWQEAEEGEGRDPDLEERSIGTSAYASADDGEDSSAEDEDEMDVDSDGDSESEGAGAEDDSSAED